MVRSVAACLTVLLALFEIGSCIKCYQCNSEQDKQCGDPFTSTKHMIDCGNQESIKYNQQFLYAVLPAEVFGSVVGAPRYCHKIVMASGTVIRTCLDGNPANLNHTCQVMDEAANTPATTMDKRILRCSVCDKDNCNGASTLFVSLPLAALAVVLALFNKQ